MGGFIFRNIGPLSSMAFRLLIFLLTRPFPLFLVFLLFILIYLTRGCRLRVLLHPLDFPLALLLVVLSLFLLPHVSLLIKCFFLSIRLCRTVFLNSVPLFVSLTGLLHGAQSFFFLWIVKYVTLIGKSHMGF